MKIDGNQLQGDLIPADICIVGAGAAGITIAREFLNTGKTVYLLEAGGYEKSEADQEFYRSESVDFKPEYLFNQDYARWSRTRFFGGSSNSWGGWSRPMERLDFEERPWVKFSGWPYRRAEIEDNYRRACDLIQIPRYDFGNETVNDVAKRSDDYDLIFSRASQNPDIEHRFFTFSPPTKFGEVYGEDLHKAPNIFVVTNASVTRIDCEEGGQRVSQVEFINEGLKKFLLKSKIIILACGGLENPRLLLNSNHQHANGLGNQNDLVGRYFMEHPHSVFATLMNRRGLDWTSSFTAKSPQDVRRIFTTSEDYQRRHGLMNYSCEMTVWDEIPSNNEAVSELLKVSDRTHDDPVYLRLYARTEMAARPSNRVSLGESRDAYGLRKIKVALEYGKEDLFTVRRSTEAVLRHLSFLNAGRAQFIEADQFEWTPITTGACHHMGTTRMSEDPRQGVVDRHCRVHGIDNLVIAGSSVFPTGGFANPTLTLVALATRIADDIKAGSIQ